jgi:hypothetical protein
MPDNLIESTPSAYGYPLPFYRMYLQGYLAWGNALTGFVDRSALDAKTKERANFVVSLLTDALAPTNTLLGNPAALKRIVDSGGTSLVAGLQNMLADLTKNQGPHTGAPELGHGDLRRRAPGGDRGDARHYWQ